MPPLRHARNRTTKAALAFLCLSACSIYLTQPPQTQNPAQTSALSGEAFMQELLRRHPVTFQEHFRMPRTTFLALRAWVIGITSVKEKYKNEPGSDARYFSLDGWSQCTRSRCTESI